MFKSASFKAFIVITILPLTVLLTFFGFGFPRGEHGNGFINNGLVILVIFGLPILLRSYFKSKKQPITKKLFLTTMATIALIVIPLSLLLRMIALRTGGDYLSCIHNGGSSIYVTDVCRGLTAVYPRTGIYYQAALSPATATFIMLYTLVCVAVVGYKSK